MLTKLTFSDRQSGIYQILNKINNKFYIGSAADFYERYHSHLHYLNSNNHHNEHLQRAYNKYGPEAFEFQILQITNELVKFEQFWIDWTNATVNGYNIRKDATSNLGLKFSEEHKAKMSAWQFGKFMSQETRDKISLALKGRTISDDVKLRMAVGHRKIDKWPCISGWKCKCDNCKEKWREIHKGYRKRKVNDPTTSCNTFQHDQCN